MRTRVQIAAFLVLVMAACPVRASSSDNTPTEQQSIDALQTRASQAQPREQCFLYAQLVQQMTEFSIRRYAAGDVVKATSLLTRIQHVAQKIHLSVADHDKRQEHRDPAQPHRLPP